MTPTAEYVGILVPIAFVFAYCGAQTVLNFRQRRYGFGVAGAICVVLVLAALVTEGWNAGLMLGVFASVRDAGR